LRPDPRDQGLGRSSPGVRFPFRAGPRLGCPCSGLATCCLRNPPRPSEPGIRLPLGFLLPRARLRRVPLFSLHRNLAVTAEWVKVARPSPVPSSGFLPLSTVLAALVARTNPLRGPPSPCAPTLRGLVSCRSRPLESPYRAFPSRGAVPALAGLLLPCGFAHDSPNGAARSKVFAAPFAYRADHSPQLALRLAGLSSRDDGFPESLGRRA
jgi:hypothetical protein